MRQAGWAGALSCGFLLLLTGCQPGGGADDADDGDPFEGAKSGSGAQPAKVRADGFSEDGLVYGADPDVPVTDIVRVLCAKLMECGLADSSFTQADCLLAYSQPCLTRYGSIEEQDGARACIDSLRNATCDQMFTPSVVPCLDAMARARSRLSGGEAARPGEACGDGVECTGLSFCDRPAECGVCQAIARLGEPCTGSLCFDGYCNPATSRCEAKLALGDACTDNQACQSRWCTAGACAIRAGDDGSPCTSNDECDTQRCTAGRCAEAAQIGAACSVTRECNALAACVNGRCTLVARCDQAKADELCGFVGCEGNLRCDFREHRCVGGPRKGVGEPCAMSSECVFDRCLDGACAKRPPSSFCAADEECESGACVDSACTGQASCTTSD